MKQNRPKEKLKMRKLIDRWSISVTFLFLFMKFLQIFRSFGAAVKDRGWRTTMNVHARHEYSKFVLTAFRLDLWSDARKQGHASYKPHSFEEASAHVIRRLVKSLGPMPQLHWQLQWLAASVNRKVKKSFDLVHAEFDPDGSLKKIQPYLARNTVQFQTLSETVREELHRVIVKKYNETRELPDFTRPWILQQKIVQTIFIKYPGFGKLSKAAKVYAKRILSAAFIAFECLPSKSLFEPERFQDPSFILRKHPGLGLLNILCRFQSNYEEADLWVQIHHIPVDGVPMQETLYRLKDEWGVRGELKFPSLKAIPAEIPQRCSTQTGAQGMYHLKSFLDFRPFLAVRKKLTEQYGLQISGEITMVSMILWGLSHHPVFKGKKFFFPVDVYEDSEKREERAVGVVLIRPSRFFNVRHPEKGFIAFQQEFNHKIEAAKTRKGESHEMLEIYSLVAPFIYHLTSTLLHRALGEFIGTVGVTMIKGSELFMTPMSDVHTDGFFAFGNFTVPTEDGGFSGVVSVRGKKEKVEDYLSALKEVTADFRHFTGLKSL